MEIRKWEGCIISVMDIICSEKQNFHCSMLNVQPLCKMKIEHWGLNIESYFNRSVQLFRRLPQNNPILIDLECISAGQEIVGLYCIDEFLFLSLVIVKMDFGRVRLGTFCF